MEIHQDAEGEQAAVWCRTFRTVTPRSRTEVAGVENPGRLLLSRCADDTRIVHHSESSSRKFGFALGTKGGHAFLLVGACGNHAAGKRFDH